MITREESIVCATVEALPEIVAAKWIWTDDDPDKTDVWVYARKRITVSDPQNAYLHITADLRYLVWINGKAVGFGPAKSHIGTPCLDKYPIGEFLHCGENTICVQVYSFGAEGYVAALMPRRGSLLASIECNGRYHVSDSTWKIYRERAYCHTGVRLNENQPFATQFDSRFSLREPWSQDYDDSSWQSARELSGLVFEPWQTIERRDIPVLNWQCRPPERVFELGVSKFSTPAAELLTQDLSEEIGNALRLPSNRGEVCLIQGIAGSPDKVVCDASDMSNDRGCYATYDFGRVWTGYPIVKLTGTPGTIVDLSYAEGLTEGRVDPSKQGLVYNDRIILAGDTVTHRIFWPKSLRYLQIDVRCGRAVIEDVCLEASTYPVVRQGQFHCSDLVLDQAWEISAHTLQLCMEDSYMDTPWRERGGWLGDIVPEAHSNYYAFGDYRLIRRFLIQHSRGQKPDGSMCGKYPAKTAADVHVWNLTYVFALEDYMRHTGDVQLTADIWPTVKGIGKWLESYRTQESLYGGFPLEVTSTINIFTFIDWAPVDTSGTNAAFNAYAYAFWRACESIARRLCYVEDARYYAYIADGLKRQFQKLFWDDDKGCFVNGRQNGKMLDRFGIHENMLAVLFDLATDEQLSSILTRFGGADALNVFKADPGVCDNLVTVAIALNKYPWTSAEPVPVGTPYFAYWMLQGLCDLGRTEFAIDFIRKHWGEFSLLGGTTVWENWTGRDSLSHAWSSAPVVIFGKYILGAFPSRDNSCVWNVFPSRSDLSWARGRVPVPGGVLGVSWQWNNQWRLEVTVPAGISINMGLPECEAAGLWLDGKDFENPERITRQGQIYLVVTVGEGMHVLEGKLSS